MQANNGSVIVHLYNSFIFYEYNHFVRCRVSIATNVLGIAEGRYFSTKVQSKN